MLHLTDETCLVRGALHTRWGVVIMDPFSFTVMLSLDDVICFTLKSLGSDSYGRLSECARN